MINPSGKNTMINLRGRVVEVSTEEVDLRRNEGWKIVVNPRQDYYIEYDLSAGGIAPSDNMIDNLAAEDLMPGRYV